MNSEGLEPPTSWAVTKCSIQLSYESFLLLRCKGKLFFYSAQIISIFFFTKVENSYFCAMFSKLLYSSKIRGYKKSLRYRKRERIVVNPSQLGSCLVYRDTKSDDSALYDRLLSQFPGVDFVSIWCVIGKESRILKRFSFTENDILVRKSALKGKRGFSDAKVEEVLKRDFDWLIDLSLDHSEITPLILTASSAKCKISWRYVGEFVADITIGDIKSREEFVDSLHEIFLTLNNRGDE